MGKYKNTNLSKAKQDKNDEFYTQYSDIEKEMNAYLNTIKRYSKIKRYSCLVMIQRGVTLLNSFSITFKNSA